MSSRNDWLLTLQQTLPNVLKLWSHSTPTFELPSISFIDEEFVRAKQIAGIIWDVDGTLMPWHGSSLSPSLRASFEKLVALEGLRHVILSNCDEHRYKELGRIFPSIPVLRAYRTGDSVIFRRLLWSGESWTGDSVRSQQASPIRKPSQVLTEFAIRELGCDRENVVMVGDQYFTDIVGANLAAIRSIKVATLGRDTFPLMVRCLQRLEQAAYRRGKRRRGLPSSAVWL